MSIDKISEQMLLSVFMANPVNMDEVTLPKIDDLAFNENKLIYSAILEMTAASEPIDVIGLAHYLDRRGELNKCGGLEYLVEVSERSGSIVNLPSYVNQIRGRSIEKKLANAGEVIKALALSRTGNYEDKMREAESLLYKIIDDNVIETNIKHINPIITDSITEIENRFANKGQLSGVPTGLAELDEITNGLQAEDLIIIAGRPSSGKTALALNIGEHAAIYGGCKVAILSIEMGSKQLGIRMLSSVGKIDSNALRTGKLRDEDFDKIGMAVGIINDIPLYIDDTANCSIMTFRSTCRKIKRKLGGLDLVIVDYLQLMSGTGKETNKKDEIGNITKALKAAAKEMHCPVIALSQLNRSLEDRKDKRPIMSDLKESSSIEQDADVIMFVYRDEVYNPEAIPGEAELIIGKQRNGAVGTIMLEFLKNYTKFQSASYAGKDY